MDHMVKAMERSLKPPVLKVSDFERTLSKNPIPDKPVLMSIPDAEHRAEFMNEEITEFLESIEAEDLEGALDALVDLNYFVLGTAVLMGLSEVWTEAFSRVHDANMAKRQPDGSVKYHPETGKIIKPEGWNAPVLTDLVTS